MEVERGRERVGGRGVRERERERETERERERQREREIRVMVKAPKMAAAILNHSQNKNRHSLRGSECLSYAHTTTVNTWETNYVIIYFF